MDRGIRLIVDEGGDSAPGKKAPGMFPRKDAERLGWGCQNTFVHYLLSGLPSRLSALCGEGYRDAGLPEATYGDFSVTKVFRTRAEQNEGEAFSGGVMVHWECGDESNVDVIARLRALSAAVLLQIADYIKVNSLSDVTLRVSLRVTAQGAVAAVNVLGVKF